MDLVQQSPPILETRLDNWDRKIGVFGGDVRILYEPDDLSIRITSKTGAFDLYLFLYTNEMMILYIRATKTQSGNDIIKLLYLAADKLGISQIELCDTSTIHNGHIRLAYYHILLHGISWYNSHGFVGTVFEEDTQYNLSQITRKIQDVTSNSMKKLLEDVLGDEYNPAITVREVMQELHWFLRRGGEDMRIYNLIEYFIRELKIRYNPFLKSKK